MENESINKIIDPAAFDQLSKLETRLEDLIKLFVEAALKAQSLGDSVAKSKWGDFTKASNDSASALQKMADLEDKVAKQEVALRNARIKAMDDFDRKVQKQIDLENKRATQSVKNAEKQRLAELKLDADRKKNMDRYEASMARKAAADEKAAAKLQENSRAYNILSNQLEESRKKAQDFAIIFGENSEEFKKQAKLVTELDTRLKAIDESLGKYGRNVGNYKSAWNGLGNSINQISRELPAFTVSAQTGFLAISNNLPALFDEISKVSDKLKATAIENAAATGEQAAATALAGGASEEAAGQIGEMATAQALQAAEGQRGIGILKAIGSALFSWNTLLSVGVTLLTVYGKDLVAYVAGLFDANEAQKELILTRKMLNEVNLKGAQNAQKEIVELKTLYDTAKNVTLTSQQRYDAAKALQEQYPKTFENLSVEKIQLGKVDEAYNRLTKSIIATARARASQEKIAENSSRILDDEQKMVDLQAQLIESRKTDSDYATAWGGSRETLDIERQIRDLAKDREILNGRNLALTKNIVDQQKKGADLADYTEDKAKKTKVDTSFEDGNKARLEGIKNTAKEIFENEEDNFGIRLQALESYQSAYESLVRTEAEKEILQAKGHVGKIKAIREQESTDLVSVQIEVNKTRREMTDKANKATLDAFTESEKKLIQSIVDSNNVQLEKIEKFRAEAAQGASEQYALGIISKKQYEETLYEIEKQAGLDRIALQLQVFERIIAIQREDLKLGIGTQKELSDSEKKASDLKIQYSKLETDAKIRDKERELAKEKEVRTKIIELGFAAYDLGVALIDGISVRRQNAIQDEINANQKKRALDIENVNDSVLSEEEKADQIAIINAKADAQETLLEQKQRTERIRQAKFDKALAIGRIVAETAIKVAEYGFVTPLAILAASLGAVAAATILATPIPKYKDGTPVGGHKHDGLALVGDGYKPELQIDPDGKMSVTPSVPTYTYLKKGTQIIGGNDFEKMISYPLIKNISQSNSTIDISRLVDEEIKTRGVLKEAYKNTKTPVIIENGIAKYKTWANQQELQAYFNRKI